ncbi:MAG: FtsW/RodA/SpoVE family cell cycle protein [Eubacterium sp.]|nr:FtsW/RodA/SpoVE family cell cycle protein [Eubacterium sp.]
MFRKIKELVTSYKLSKLNFRLLVYVFALTTLGVFAIGSATEGQDYQMRQIVGVVVALIGLVVLTLFSYKFVFKFYWPLYFVAIGLLLLVLILGQTKLGATRWIDLGFVQFQPSEVAKLFLIIFVVMFIQKHYETLDTPKTLGLVNLFALIILFLIFREPDLSSTIVLFVTFCAIMFLSNMSGKIIAAIAIIAVPIVLVFGFFAVNPNSGILQEYQYNRIVGFFQEDNKEAKEIRYQQENSLLAIGSGGLKGKGIENENATSVKNGKFLSEAHTDFIFTIIGEELGFFGAAAVIILLLLVVIECIIVGSRAPDISSRLFCYGFGVLIAIQSFINISVATMLLPNTGVTLPFVSYGPTSLLSLFCGVGIVLNIGLQRQK